MIGTERPRNNQGLTPMRSRTPMDHSALVDSAGSKTSDLHSAPLGGEVELTYLNSSLAQPSAVVDEEKGRDLTIIFEAMTFRPALE